MKFVEKCFDSALSCEEVGSEVFLTLDNASKDLAAKAGIIRATISDVDKACVGEEEIYFNAQNPATCRETKLKKKVKTYRHCYTFQYEDSELSDPSISLSDKDICKAVSSDGSIKYIQACIPDALTCADIVACLPSDVLVDNGDGTYTHTAVDGTVVVIDPGTDTLVSNADGSYTHTAVDGTVTVIVAAPAAGNSSLVQDNATGIITHTAGDSTISTADVTSTDAGNIITTGADGGSFLNCAAILACGTDVLVDNGDGTYTHTALDGTIVIINDTDSLVANADGTYTHTAVDGTVTVITVGGAFSITDGTTTEVVNAGDTVTFVGATDEGGTQVTGAASAVQVTVSATDEVEIELQIANDAETEAATGVVGDTNQLEVDANGNLYVPCRTSVEEEISCGAIDGEGIRKLVFVDCAGAEVEVSEGGCFYKNQDTTALGAVGDLVALKKSIVSLGEFELAQADDKVNEAYAVGEIISATQVKLIEGFQELSVPHGLTIGESYVLSDTVAGGLLDQTTAEGIADFDMYQPLLEVLSEQCVKVTCVAAICYDPSCEDEVCDIAQATLGTADDVTDQPLLDVLIAIEAGTWPGGCTAYVAGDATTGSGYKLAVAEDCAVWRAVPVLDETGAVVGFTKELNGSKSGEVLVSTSLHLIPQSQVDAGGLAGSAVDGNSLVEGDASIFLGNVTPDGCLHINIGGKIVIPTEVVDPNAPAYSFKPQGDLGVASDYTETDGFDNIVLETDIVGPCGDFATFPYDCTTGMVGGYIKECVSPTLCCGTYCYWIGFENVTPFTMTQSTYIRETSGTGSVTGVNISPKITSSGQLNLSVNNAQGGQGVLHFGATLQPNKWYKVTINFEFNSGIGTNDGSIDWTIDEYPGDIANGFVGGTPVNVEIQATTPWDSHQNNQAECIDFARPIGNGDSTAGTCVDGAEPAYVAFGGMTLEAC